MSSAIVVRRKRTQVKCACEPCHRACKKCDDVRPCGRCVRYGIADSCVDHTRKARQSGVKRGPYRRTPHTEGSFAALRFSGHHLTAASMSSLTTQTLLNLPSELSSDPAALVDIDDETASASSSAASTLSSPTSSPSPIEGSYPFPPIYQQQQQQQHSYAQHPLYLAYSRLADSLPSNMSSHAIPPFVGASTLPQSPTPTTPLYNYESTRYANRLLTPEEPSSSLSFYSSSLLYGADARDPFASSQPASVGHPDSASFLPPLHRLNLPRSDASLRTSPTTAASRAAVSYAVKHEADVPPSPVSPIFYKLRYEQDGRQHPLAWSTLPDIHGAGHPALSESRYAKLSLVHGHPNCEESEMYSIRDTKNSAMIALPGHNATKTEAIDVLAAVCTDILAQDEHANAMAPVSFLHSSIDQQTTAGTHLQLA